MLKNKEIVLKRRNLFYTVTSAAFVFVSTTCAGMWNVKTVGPVVPGQSTWSISARLGAISDETTPIPLFNSDAVGGAIIIAQAGNYQVAEDLTCSIGITTNSVHIDLGNHKISFPASNIAGVVVVPGLTEISVYNGYIQNIGATEITAGIYIGYGCSKVSLHDLAIYSCHHGVHCEGSNGQEIVESQFVDLSLMSNDIGMLLNYTNANNIKNCNALYSTETGFEIANGQSNCFYDCNALKSTGTGTVIGFKSADGDSNMFYRCVAKQTMTNSTTFGDKACGFLLTGSETKTKIVNSIVNQTDVVSSQTAVTYGMHFAPVFNGGLTQVYSDSISANQQFTSQWSPNSMYLLQDEAGKTVIRGWNGSTLTTITSVTLAGSVGSAWSPDGKYVVITYTSGGNGFVNVYSFNGTSLTLVGTSASLGAVLPQFPQWSGTGKYIAFATYPGGLSAISMMRFEGTTPILVTSSPSFASSASTSAQVFAWSPDGQYIAAVKSAAQILVFKVYPDTTISQVAVGTTLGTDATTLAWSPCGKYVAVGSSTGGNIRVFAFTGNALIPACPDVTVGSTGVWALNWSPDGQYLVAVGHSSPFPTVVFHFSGIALTQVGTTINGVSASYALQFSPGGRYIAVAENTGRVEIFSAMYAPTNCLVDNCVVADTQATNFNMGRGIVGAGSNVFLRSVSCNNNVNYSYGIPNAYEGRFDVLRGLVQPYDNVSMPELL